jgi:hypothetical protein
MLTLAGKIDGKGFQGIGKFIDAEVPKDPAFAEKPPGQNPPAQE